MTTLRLLILRLFVTSVMVNTSIMALAQNAQTPSFTPPKQSPTGTQTAGASPAPATGLSDQTSRLVRIWGGYQHVTMGSFNEKMRLEGNDAIRGGLNAGVEIAPLPIIKFNPSISILFPALGFEYLKLNSKTTHKTDVGSATANWNLPTFGVIAAPELKYKCFYVRPVGLGAYWLSPSLHDQLTVSDQPNSKLVLSDETLGFSSIVGWILPVWKGNDPFHVSFEGGYRYLNFTNVKITPVGDFMTPGGIAQVSVLPEDVNYSGWVIRAVFSYK